MPCQAVRRRSGSLSLQILLGRFCCFQSKGHGAPVEDCNGSAGSSDHSVGWVGVGSRDGDLKGDRTQRNRRFSKLVGQTRRLLTRRVAYTADEPVGTTTRDLLPTLERRRFTQTWTRHTWRRRRCETDGRRNWRKETCASFVGTVEGTKGTSQVGKRSPERTKLDVAAVDVVGKVVHLPDEEGHVARETLQW